MYICRKICIHGYRYILIGDLVQHCIECPALWKVLYNLSGSGQSAVSILICEGQPPPPISTPWGAYSGAASHGTEAAEVWFY